MTDKNALRAEIEIDAEPARVWAILMDFEAYPEWNPFITSIEGEQAVGGHAPAPSAAGGGAATISRSVTSGREPPSAG